MNADYKKMDTYELGMLSARPGESQAPALAELKRREVEQRRARWTNRHVDEVAIKEFGTFELSEAVTFGRITQEQVDAELARRREQAEKMKTSSYRDRFSTLRGGR